MVGLGFNCPQCPNSLKEIKKKQMSWPKLQELSGFVQRERLGHFLKPCGNNIKACNGGGWEKKKTFAVSWEETMWSAVDKNGAKGQKVSPGFFDLWRVNKLLRTKNIYEYKSYYHSFQFLTYYSSKHCED